MNSRKLLEVVKRYLYHILIHTGIIYHILPLLYRFKSKIIPTRRFINHVIKDKRGSAIGVTKVRGKLYPAFGVKRLQSVKDITIRENDVLLCGYPKTGCHWTFEILRMLQTKKLGTSRCGKGFEGMIDMIPDYILDSLPSPRTLNSHLWYDELPTGIKLKKNKIILTIRSAKDTVVSFYNHHINLSEYDYDGSFNDFFKLFLEGNLEYGNYFDFYEDWARAMKTWDNDRIFVLRYEDLKRNTAKVILKIAHFLDLDISQQFAEDVANESDFHSMKRKRTQGNSASIFRKGVVGDWTNWLTKDQREICDRLWKDRLSGIAHYQQ